MHQQRCKSNRQTVLLLKLLLHKQSGMRPPVKQRLKNRKGKLPLAMSLRRLVPRLKQGHAKLAPLVGAIPAVVADMTPATTIVVAARSGVAATPVMTVESANAIARMNGSVGGSPAPATVGVDAVGVIVMKRRVSTITHLTSTLTRRLLMSIAAMIADRLGAQRKRLIRHHRLQ